MADLPPAATTVVVTDIRIPFVRLMLFMVKIALAAIPAAIIVGVILALLSALVTALFGGSFFTWRFGGQI